MKKKLLLLLPLLLLTLASCTSNVRNEEGKVENYGHYTGGIITLCKHGLEEGGVTFIRDTYTDNIYMIHYEGHGYAGGGGLTPYYNAEGQIMKYSEFVEVHKH